MPAQIQPIRARNKLVAFIQDVHGLLKNLAETGRDPKGKSLFPTVLQPLIKAAWRECDHDFRLNQAIAKIRSLPSRRLAWAGLYGRQLELKEQIIKQCDERYKRKGGPKPLHRLLEAIDTVLGSLVAATGIGEALKEFKENLMNLLKYKQE